jgi:broad specificity phosphatase PhoE
LNTLYLVRHGENLANLTREFSCRRVDYPLTEKGILQAEQTAAHFAALPIAAIYSSPLWRAHETARILAAPHSLPVIIVEQLREVNVGRLEDEPPSEENWALHDRIFDAWRAGEQRARFPGGESYTELRSRMREGLRRAIAGRDGQQLVIVAHGGIFAATLHELCWNIPASETNYWHLHNCSITELTLEETSGTLQGELVRWGDCGHLSGEAARLVPVRQAES